MGGRSSGRQSLHTLMGRRQLPRVPDTAAVSRVPTRFSARLMAR